MNETRIITLSDGNEYTLKAFNIGDFIEIEKKFGSLNLDLAKLEPTTFWFWLSLKKTHKDLTIEQMYELIDAKFINDGGLAKILQLLTELNGWDKVKNEPSPAKAS